MTDLPNDAALDRATDPEYSAVSAEAVLGVVASALGVSGLFVWTLLGRPFTAQDLFFTLLVAVALPVIGLVLSLRALVRIRDSFGALTGRRLALVGAIGGAALAVLAVAINGLVYHRTRGELLALRDQALMVVDDMIEGHAELAYVEIPEKWRAQTAPDARSFDAFARSMFRGAGEVERRELISLRILSEPDDQGYILAPARVLVDLERRQVRVTVHFALDDDGVWKVRHIGAQETMESMRRFQPRGPLGPGPALPEDVGEEAGAAPAPEAPAPGAEPETRPVPPPPVSEADPPAAP